MKPLNLTFFNCHVQPLQLVEVEGYYQYQEKIISVTQTHYDVAD
jgi:hypothetical protein